jgi:hypothetical protein
MFTKTEFYNKAKGRKIYLRPFMFRKRELCSTKGNTKFVTNDFIKDMNPTITIIGAGISGFQQDCICIVSFSVK